MKKYLTWNREINSLLKDGFKPTTFRGRKNIYEVSFTKRTEKPFRIDGVSYMQEDFTQKELHKILDILKKNNIISKLN